MWIRTLKYCLYNKFILSFSFCVKELLEPTNGLEVQKVINKNYDDFTIL